MKKIYFIFIISFFNISAQITLSPLWAPNDYWRPETYTDHAGINQSDYKAVDFYYHTRNRPDIYRNGDVTNIARNIYSPHGGRVYLFLYEVTKLSSNNRHFDKVNALNIISGQDPVPKHSFWFLDKNNNKTEIDYELVLDSASYTSLFAHLQISDDILNQINPVNIETKVRDAISKIYYLQAPINADAVRRVAINTKLDLERGKSIGTLNYFGLAGAFHCHYMIYHNINFSDSNPFLDPDYLLDLKITPLVSINGQKIFDAPYENKYYSYYRYIYQYPSMCRTFFSGNVVINSLWDNTSYVNIRSTAGGIKFDTISNNSNGTIVEGPVSAEILSIDAHIWYKISFSNKTGWVAAEYLDKKDSPNNISYNLINGLNLITFPFNPQPSKFSDIFPNTGLFQYVFYLDDQGSLAWGLSSEVSASAKKGYFIFVDGNHSINVSGDQVNKEIILHRQLNMIGVTQNIIPPYNPTVFDTAVKWGSDGFTFINIYQTGFTPGAAYFVYSSTDNNILIPSAELASIHNIKGKEILNIQKILSDVQFECSFLVTQTGADNSPSLNLGIKPNALEGYDSFDEVRPVPLMGNLIGYFDESYGLKKSIKPFNYTKEWPLVLQSPIPMPNSQPNLNTIQLIWTIPNSGTLPPNTAIKLLDENHNVLIPDMLNTNHISFTPTQGGAIKKYFIQFHFQDIQSLPFVQTLDATNISNQGVVLNGSVNANGLTTNSYFKYGADQNNLSDSTTIVNIGNGTINQSYSSILSNLSASSLYYYKAVAVNSFGYSQGSVKTFTTSQTSGIPLIISLAASNVTLKSAVLKAMVNPNGVASKYYFEYGTSPNYGYQTQEQPIDSGSSFLDVSFNLSGLETNRNYFFRVVASNIYGTNSGSCISFITSTQTALWNQTNGPLGGSVNRFHKTGPRLIVSVGYNGIYYTDNNGDIFIKSNISYQGGTSYLNVNNIIFTCINGEGLFTSIDQGQTWNKTALDGKAVFSLAKNSLNNIFASSDGIYKSEDLGNSWNKINNLEEVLRLVVDNNNSIYAASYSSGKILKSSDNGSTWNDVGSDSYQATSIKVNNYNHIFVGTDWGLKRSVDGGQSWVFITNISPTFNIIDLYINENNTIYICTSSGCYYSTTNGATWIKYQNLPSATSNTTLYSSIIEKDNIIFVGSNTTGMYVSTDNGITWLNKNSGMKATSMVHMTKTTSNYILAVDYNDGGIYRSIDSGDNWLKMNQGILSTDNRSGIITDRMDNLFYASDGIYKSTNFGQSWIKEYSASGTYCTLGYFNDKIFGSIYGNQTYLAYSANGGTTWETIITPDILISIFIDQNMILGGGYNNKSLLRSTDFGITWQNIMLNGSTAKVKKIVKNAISNSLFACTEDNGIFKSTDNGLTWAQKNNGLNNLCINSIAINNFGEVYLATAGGLYVSKDDGNSWSKIEDGLEPAYLNSIIINEDGKIYLGTQGYGIWKSKYSVNQPINIISPSGAEDWKIGETQDISWFTSGQSKLKIEFSMDDGIHWIEIVNNFNADDKKYTWIVPNSPSSECRIRISNPNNQLVNATSAKFAISVPTGIQDRNNIPKSYALYQNYPNPFNPSTIISYDLPKGGMVSIKIYDLLGREVKTLVNEYKNAGKYNTEFNAGSLASGIYFYRLNAGNFTEIKKLILMK